MDSCFKQVLRECQQNLRGLELYVFRALIDLSLVLDNNIENPHLMLLFFNHFSSSFYLHFFPLFCMTSHRLKEALSELMLCTPSNRRPPLSYHTKMADFGVLCSSSLENICNNSEKCFEYGKQRQSNR